MTQSVEVSAGSDLPQTEKASTGTNITDKLVGNLPLVNRRFNDLAILTPGTSLCSPRFAGRRFRGGRHQIAIN